MAGDQSIENRVVTIRHQTAHARITAERRFESFRKGVARQQLSLETVVAQKLVQRIGSH